MKRRTYLIIACFMACLVCVVYSMTGCISQPEHKHAQSLAQAYYESCSFKMTNKKEWKLITAPKGFRTTQSEPAVERLYFQNGDVLMVLLCIPKNTEFDIFNQYHTQTISNDYSEFAVLQGKLFTFRENSAYWLLYEGVLKSSGIKKHGYTIIVDRGNKGLIISLSADADEEHRYSPIFQSGVRAIELL